MLRWDVTIEVEGEQPQTYPRARVTIGHDTVKLHHDRKPTDDEVAAFVEGDGSFDDATQELWVDSSSIADDALVLTGTEHTGGATDIEGRLRMRWTLRLT